MKTINAANKPSYKSSRDYAKLWELAQSERVICWLDYYESCIEIASTKCTIYDNGKVVVEISARGICYIDSKNINEFISDCNKYNLEYVEPDSSKTIHSDEF